MFLFRAFFSLALFYCPLEEYWFLKFVPKPQVFHLGSLNAPWAKPE